MTARAIKRRAKKAAEAAAAAASTAGNGSSSDGGDNSSSSTKRKGKVTATAIPSKKKAVVLLPPAPPPIVAAVTATTATTAVLSSSRRVSPSTSVESIPVTRSGTPSPPRAILSKRSSPPPPPPSSPPRVDTTEIIGYVDDLVDADVVDAAPVVVVSSSSASTSSSTQKHGRRNEVRSLSNGDINQSGDILIRSSSRSPVPKRSRRLMFGNEGYDPMLVAPIDPSSLEIMPSTRIPSRIQLQVDEPRVVQSGMKLLLPWIYRINEQFGMYARHVPWFQKAIANQHLPLRICPNVSTFTIRSITSFSTSIVMSYNCDSLFV
jgi:hypothetical protein